MTMMRPVRGAKDLLPNEYYFFEKIVETARSEAKLYGYQDFATPIFEYTDVFNRTLGETSDVVNKEMYTFIDRGGDSITLRPEFTAGIMRAIISGGLSHSLPMRLFSSGPVFRHDRPQAGRQRQFHQINCEIIGESSHQIDAELVKLASDILENLGIRKDTVLHINSLGCTESRALFHVKLKEFLLKFENDLSPDSKQRLHKNPMRILDSKDQNDQKILQDAPSIADSYTKESKERFEQTLSLLEDFKVAYEVDSKLVRGLDYYCHTAFEFVTDKLGSQSTVIGGGRYDGLAKIMSNDKYDFPAIGFAGGIERLMMMYNLTSEEPKPSKNIAIIPIGEESINEAYIIASKIRSCNIASIVYASGKIGKRIERASSGGSIFAIFVGENEIKTQLYKLKNLESGEENELSLPEIIKAIG